VDKSFVDRLESPCGNRGALRFECAFRLASIRNDLFSGPALLWRQAPPSCFFQAMDEFGTSPRSTRVCVRWRITASCDSLSPAARYPRQDGAVQWSRHLSRDSDSSAVFVPQWLAALDQGQDSGSGTNRALNGLSSVERNASHKWGSSNGQE
jgi:hypothetical protein